MILLTAAHLTAASETAATVVAPGGGGGYALKCSGKLRTVAAHPR
eukprot:CAMPEP_0119076110 /NCGR_PEP_ID=MMETSP1178-20130426/84166_1 /TAXON_ID=33656 /ORGANISM="unid sp, Strain CCMP2000" /LENGTH=44 /DNA_ID= /DNA_START= /DNA_END= /DNA_ORIENTATION=